MSKDFIIIAVLYQVNISSKNNALALEFKNDVVTCYLSYIFNALHTF